LFDETVCGDEVTALKPAPEAYDVAARRLGVSAVACLVVEDSEVGAAAAKAFGAPCVLVRFGS
jgi:HAD superfamily hydrolase (TIGR01509 family)